MEKSRPYVILSAAMSLDGKIATRTGDSKLSSQQDLSRVHSLRSKVDAILVGKNTIQRDNPLLTTRYAKGKNPTRIILDSKGTISKNSRILKTCNKIPTIIAISKNTSKKNHEKLKTFPLTIIQAGKEIVSLKLLLKKLVRQKIDTLLVEGGGTVNWEFIKGGLFDEIIITVSPVLIGGRESISLVQGKGFEAILKSPKLSLKSVKRQGNEIVLHYLKL